MHCPGSAECLVVHSVGSAAPTPAIFAREVSAPEYHVSVLPPKIIEPNLGSAGGSEAGCVSDNAPTATRQGQSFKCERQV